MTTLKTDSFTGCCGARIIYGFGGSAHDGTRRESVIDLATVATDLDWIEKQAWGISQLMITLNSDQYPIYHDTLREQGYRLTFVNESVGHKTAIFTYIKRINRTSLESTKNRLTELGMDVILPVHKVLNTNVANREEQ